MRLNSFSLQKKFSIKCRHLYISRSMSSGVCAAGMLGDDHLGAALVQVRDDVIAVESGIADQRAECDPVDERRHANRVETLPWQEHKTYEVAERVGERQDFGGQAAFGAANSLASASPFLHPVRAGGP